MYSFCKQLLFIALVRFCAGLEVLHNGTEPDLFQLYNFKTGQFLPVHIISELPRDYIINRAYGKSDTISGIFESSNRISTTLEMSSEVELQARIGLVRSGSTVQFQRDTSKSKSAREVKGYIVVHEGTVEETVKPCNPNLTKLILDDFLNPKLFDATHFVVAKSFGLRVELDLIDENKRNESRESKEANLDNGIQYALSSAGKVKTEYSSQLKYSSSFSSIKVHVKSNLRIAGNFPRSVNEIADFLKYLPSALNNTNLGKGMPFRYVVEDIELLRRCHNSKYHGEFTVVGQVSSEKCSILNNFLKTQDEKASEIVDWLKDFHDFRKCLPGLDTEGMPLLKLKVENFTLHFNDQIRSTYLAVTKGEKNESDFDTILALAADDVNSPTKVLELLNTTYRSVKDKLYLFRMQEFHGIKCLPVGAKRHLTFNDNYEIYLLYNSTDYNDNYLSNLLSMLREKRTFYSKSSAYIVDCHYRSTYPVCKYLDNYHGGNIVFFGKLGRMIEVRIGKFSYKLVSADTPEHEIKAMTNDKDIIIGGMVAPEFRKSTPISSSIEIMIFWTRVMLG